MAVVMFYWIGRAKQKERHDPSAAQQSFVQHRAELQAAFFAAALASGKPRGLRWKDCQWNDLIEWIRDKKSAQLLVLVGVTISYEAIEGGDMEGVEAVGNLRNATAVFFFDGNEWRTVGRAIFNLNPDEALVHFQSGYERVESPGTE
jgi:hypothetical protein